MVSRKMPPENFPPENYPSPRKNLLYTETQLQITECNLANMPADIKPKNCLQKLYFLTSWMSYVCLLHVHFTFVFFWDEVRSKKI